MPEPLVGIVAGSESDLPVVKEGCEILDYLGITYELVISSAHRAPRKTVKYASSAAERGLLVIIAAAGGAAHLPGVIAAYTPLPVIGLPISSGALNGLDALFSIVQMPSGVPVATVAINGAKNAALLAGQIIGVSDLPMREKIKQYKEALAARLEEKPTH
ncbi:MAG TPA: 5-(carboxyamino)imidazole ribonucleotide mutase [Desulfotomaculum sp.]|nr:MAG: N5-carboxyaminoimidazole ribonucleotide mutase [Desulfofundulus kuznetsovii]HAG10751.1 5-(carboxyamino)imidazole ribonucleotide mutase [Desulfotomaculum sp.]HBY03922.1 5-(carboxyamino)imidazole ribonucleotide mutase [Desulfotomaculum sp.]